MSHTHFKDPVVQVRVVDCGNAKIALHALSVKSLPNVEAGHCMEEEKETVLIIIIISQLQRTRNFNNLH